MKVLHIIGVDLSKKTIDLFCYDHHYPLVIENGINGFNQMVTWFKQMDLDFSRIMLVMEHTGLYSLRFEGFLHRHSIKFTKRPALDIKRSLGIVRGKSDKIDACRIARYAVEKKDTLVATAPPDESLKLLQMLHSTRQSFVRNRASVKTSLKEYMGILSKKDLLIQTRMMLIKSFDQQIKKVEEEMSKIIQSNPDLKHNLDLLLTIKGVGKIVALAVIIKTKNFTAFSTARKFACYCGTAPFEHSSGSSIRKRSRVSHLADKNLKTLLDQSAKSAIQYDKELREYYLKRTEIGKPKMSTINIVRNKILYRMFAVIKRQTPYSENYLLTA
jgi:transposase